MVLTLPFAIKTTSRNDSHVIEPVSNSPALPNQGIEFGNQNAVNDKPSGQSRLVFASYNIRYAVGRYLILSGLLRKIGYNFPRDRAAMVRQNIRTAARIFSDGGLLPRPDILALQEVDKETSRAGRLHVAAELAKQMDTSYVHVSAGLPRGLTPKQREWWLNFEEQIAIDDEGEMGVAFLSRVPLQEITRIDLPWHDCPWRPRLAVGATLLLGKKKVRIFNVHVDPHGPDSNQHAQMERLLEHVRDDEPTVILGDFNTLSTQKAIAIRRLMESRGFTTPFPTQIATWRGAGVVRFHVDWIFVRGLDVNRWGVAKPLNVSDHWPIWAEIES